jgi:hypothetical protein
MVTLRLGDGGDPVGESQRVGEAREVEDPLEPGNTVALQRSPGGDLALSSAISASVSRGESRRQAPQRSADSVLIARTSQGGLREPAPGPRPRARTGPPTAAYLTPPTGLPSGAL